MAVTPTPEDYPPFDGTPRAGLLDTQGRSPLRRHAGGGWLLPDRVRVSLMRRLARPRRAPDATRTMLDAAGRVPDDLRIHDLDRARTSELSAEFGLDGATAILHHVARRDPANAAALADLEGWSPLTPGAGTPNLRGRLLLVPAAFYEEMPEFGGDGLAFRQAAAACGLDARLLSMPGLAPLDVGCRFVEHALRELHAEDPDAPLVVVTLSKGGGELRLVLEAGGVPLPPRTTWVNVCGLVRGAELNRGIAGGATRTVRAARRRVVAIGIPPRSITDYLNDAPGPLASTPQIPDNVDIVSLVPMPLTTTVSPLLRARHARIGAAGPNDGVTLACDSILPRGIVVPVLDADHYMRSHAATLAMWKVLAWLGRTGRVDTLC